jgi:hypothetical protein
MEAADSGEFIILAGIVVDENSVPVNHIKVTAEWDSKDSPIEVYSSSKGIFMLELDATGLDYPLMITLTFTDIDGEDNGGIFMQSVSKVVFMEKDDPTDEIPSIPTYQLTHATASESSQQSL